MINVTTVSEVTGISELCAMVAWTLATIGMARVVFGSMPAQIIKDRLSQRIAPRKKRRKQIDWELRHGLEWSEELERGDPHVVRRPTTPGRRERLLVEWRELNSGPLWERVTVWILACPACQAFWCSLILIVASRGQVGLEELASALAYSAAAQLVASRMHGRPQGEPSSGGRGCKTCGR
jgi:hypothetical protein